MTQLADVVCRMLMLHPFIVKCPDAIPLYALWHGTYIAKTAAVNIDKVVEMAFVFQFCQGSLDSFFKSHVLRGSYSCRFKQYDIIIAVSCFFEQEAYVIANHLWADRWSQPSAHQYMTFHHHEDGVYVAGFQTGGYQKAGVYAGAQFFGQYFVCQPYALATCFKTGRWSGINNAL